VVQRSIRIGLSRFFVAFTLIEVLLVLAIISALISLSWPATTRLLERLAVRTAVAEFRSALALARSEAMRRNQRVDVLAVGPAGWRSGWLVMIDTNSNHTADRDELVLYRSSVPTAGLSVQAALTDPQGSYLAFDPSGRPRTASSAMVPQYGSLIFTSGSQQRKLVIGFLGRVRTCDPVTEGVAC
jgi:type IV fimbrial biogenesis protein FimT